MPTEFLSKELIKKIVYMINFELLKKEGAWVGTISGYSEEEEKKKDLFIANETEIVLNPERFGQKSSVLSCMPQVKHRMAFTP